jgi:hypothetical protein
MNSCFHDPALPAVSGAPDHTCNLLAALGHIYLEAGLPLAAALEAALADFKSFGGDTSLCRT